MLVGQWIVAGRKNAQGRKHTIFDWPNYTDIWHVCKYSSQDNFENSTNNILDVISKMFSTTATNAQNVWTIDSNLQLLCYYRVIFKQLVPSLIQS
jgi:hypothetical protein